MADKDTKKHSDKEENNINQNSENEMPENLYREKDEIIQNLAKLLEAEKEAKLMVLADFENFKKRVQKEREEFNLFATAGILNLFLEVMDDLERAIGDMKEVPEGLAMISDKIHGLLNEQGLEVFEIKVGDKFDPKVMEAIGTVMIDDKEKENTVIHIERKGYKLKDKDFVVRGCRVIVGKVNPK